jgi:membrane protein involved in colicin uptake
LESSLLNDIVKKVDQDKVAAELKAKQEAEAKAAAEKAAAELKAKQEAEAKAAAEKAAAELKAKQEAEAKAAAEKAAASKKTTIICIKGKLTKKVTAVNPKCPSGYKKK